ncbi:hypothetical protein MMC22_010385 [Lobaria immixta]|nr:hypothetical protein [Lobaria immixta]
MNSDVAAVPGSGDSGFQSPHPEVPCLLATPTPITAHTEKREERQERGRKEPQQSSRQRLQKEQRRRDGVHPKLCHLAQLPNELLLQVMHHMDKGSLKSFVLTSRRMHHVREASPIAVFKGMRRKRFPAYLSVFGDPNKASEEQVEEMEIVALVSDWCRDAPRPRYHDRRTLWWHHIADLAILEENINAETTALGILAGGNSFDTALSRDAILLQWRLSLRMARTTKEFGRQAEIFFNQPAEAQHQLLTIAQFLGTQIENRVGLAAIAGCWARLEVHLPEVGSLEEVWFLGWIATRVAAYTLAAIFRTGPRAIAELLQRARDSTEVSQIRFDFVQMLVNDQLEAGTGEFEMGMMMGQIIGFHDLTFATTKQQVESQLKFWRCQSAENHMIHLQHFVGL